MNKINELIIELKKIELKLEEEIQKSKKDYFYSIQKRKIRFEREIQKYNRKLAKGVIRYLLDVKPVYFLTAPVIFFLFFPALLLDACVSFYQFSCFPVYKIPKVNRKDYIFLDHQFLGYLNIFEKINCAYCSYFNGLMAYISEVAGRTEQHFCPIKHASKLISIHSRYNKFLDYGAADDYKKTSGKIKKDFKDIKTGN